MKTTLESFVHESFNTIISQLDLTIAKALGPLLRSANFEFGIINEESKRRDDNVLRISVYPPPPSPDAPVLVKRYKILNSQFDNKIKI